MTVIVNLLGLFKFTNGLLLEDDTTRITDLGLVESVKKAKGYDL